jgi:galactokinase
MLDETAPSVDRLTLAQICQRAENGYVGVQSGLMDQFAESCGVAGAAMLLDCRSLEWRPIALPDGLELVVCHTGSRRHLDGSAYNERRGQCEAVVQVLARDDPAIRSLRDVRPEHLRAAGDRLDPVSRRRAEHVVSENERVLECVAALEADDRATIGSLFAASHASLRDRYQVSSPELDAMVEIARSVPGVVAARMTGAGFGGCTVNLLETGAAMALRRAVEAEYAARTGLEPMVLPVSATAGAGRLV